MQCAPPLFAIKYIKHLIDGVGISGAAVGAPKSRLNHGKIPQRVGLSKMHVRNETYIRLAPAITESSS